MAHPSNGPAIRPRSRRDDHTSFDVPKIGQWDPQLAVSIVVPVSYGHDKLDAVLEVLSIQTYPSRLLQIVLVHEGPFPAGLTDAKPENLTVVRNEAADSGRAGAVRVGASIADGDVVLPLDPDMLICREHVEAHMRWHHRQDHLVVVGSVPSCDGTDRDGRDSIPLSPDAMGQQDEPLHSDEAVDDEAMAVFRNSAALFAEGSWIYSVTNGATISWTPRLYREAGGIDVSLSNGGVVEFCYRLMQAGAVFVREKAARSWRPDILQTEIRTAEMARCSEPMLRHRLPVRRDWRMEPGRQWKVPYVDVVVEVNDGSYEDVSSTVSGALASTLPDVRVVIIGPWSTLAVRPPDPLDDPLLDLRLTQEAFIHDGRVEFRESIPATSAPVPFRFLCPPGVVPTPPAVERLVELADQNCYGVVFLAFPHGTDLLIARLERTQAFARALALRDDDESVVDVVNDLYGSYWIDGSEWALVPAKRAPRAVPISEVRAEVEKWKTEALRRKNEAKRWKDEASQLKLELHSIRNARRGSAWVRRFDGKVARRLVGKSLEVAKRLAG